MRTSNILNALVLSVLCGTSVSIASAQPASEPPSRQDDSEMRRDEAPRNNNTDGRPDRDRRGGPDADRGPRRNRDGRGDRDGGGSRGPDGQDRPQARGDGTGPDGPMNRPNDHQPGRRHRADNNGPRHDRGPMMGGRGGDGFQGGGPRGPMMGGRGGEGFQGGGPRGPMMGGRGGEGFQGGGPRGPMMGGRGGEGFQGNRREALVEKFRQLPPEKREKLVKRFRDRMQQPMGGQHRGPRGGFGGGPQVQ